MHVALVVDDDKDLRDIICRTLESEGWRTLSAGDGEEALELLRTSADRPCLIVLDLLMPHMNGWEFRDRQIADPALRDIPVLVLSGASGSRPLGVPVVEKPFDLEALVRKMAASCGHRGAAAPNF